MKRKWRREWDRQQQGQSAARSLNPGRSSLQALAKIILPPVAAATLLLSAMTLPAYASLDGGQITAGAGSISQSGNITNITQTTNKLSIDWQSFNIGANETVNFLQPGASSIALNRVVGNNASSIYGKLNANGQVFLINTNGILFAPGSSVNVGGIVASTLSISDADFQKGKYDFTGNGGSVINQGSITAVSGGYVALLGAQVSNQGVIVANQGTVALGAGSAATLDFHGDGLYSLAVTQEALDALAENHKLIQANGGQVVMTARAASDLAGSVLKNTGVIEAQSIGNSNGIITLDGGSVGAVVNSGVLDASGKDAGQTGGTVKVLGNDLTLAAGTAIDVSGANGGGTVLLGGNKQGRGPEQNAATTTVANNVTINADAITAGDGGTIVVWSDGATSFNGTASAKGGTSSGDGGFIETSGKKLKIGNNALITTVAANGKTGTWLLDPDGFTISAVGGDITGVELGSQLGSNNVLILSTGGRGYDGSINVNDTVNWSANTTLTLNATNKINVNAPITGSGASSGLALNALLDININSPSSLQVNTLTANATGNINFNAPQSWTNDGAWSFTGNNINVNDTVNWSAGTLTLNAGKFVNLNAVMTAANQGSLVMNYNDDIDTSTDAKGNPTSKYGTPLGGLSPLFDKKTGTYVGRIDFSGNTAANPLTINGNQYTLITSIASPTLADGSANPHDISVINKNGGVGFYALASNLIAPDTALTDSLISKFSSGAVLEGLGNNIANLTIDSSSFYLALVGTNYGVIRDLSLTNVNITSDRGYIGAIAGYNYSKIINVAATGSIIVTNPTNSLGGYSIAPGVGGLVGINSGVIYGGYANVDVDTNNSSNVGGLVGSNSGTTAVIQNSVSLGNVTSYQDAATNNNAGGFAGSNSGSIFNSGATGNVNVGTNPNSQYASFSAVGGFVGTNSGGTIDNSYATGNVVLSQGKVISWASGLNDGAAGIGGFVGTLAGGSITNSSSFGSLLAVSSAVNTVTNTGAFAGNVSAAATMEGNTYSSATSGAYGGIGKGSMTGLTSTTDTGPSSTQGPLSSNTQQAQQAAEARSEATNLANQATAEQANAGMYASQEQAIAIAQAGISEQSGQTEGHTLKTAEDRSNPDNLWQVSSGDASSYSADITAVQADGVEYQLEDAEPNNEDDDSKGKK
ncbi:filamentous hemagglutinin N-terminal domain-containing protein [Sporomusa sp. KB1]|jgi:filamentous hemagglutinin family protein|uniref:beta strand repeat-containing protein n=1 Tax=Sporomusa sp. KB1 TaxID=943346 RepID=UPI0011A7A528|nr:filamentous hemagglutinin N-terminal domain-containing protein [Sporomusa sp. KB1]TWH51745.1 filamentous hemagglutinin family protein [Sporomusa sp. KB1]